MSKENEIKEATERQHAIANRILLIVKDEVLKLNKLKAAYDKGLKDGYACMPRNIE